MVKKFTTSFILLMIMSIPLSLFAQPSNGIVKGKVVDVDTQAPLEYATVTIFSQKDSSIVTGDISNEQGVFAIETRGGKHFAKIEFIGFESQIINDIIINRQNKLADLGTIKLGVNSETLVEVEVRAEKSSVQMTLDKRIFNVGKDLANAGGSAADILDEVPSVAVDVEGNVSLRGSEGVQILIDGKPSGLVGIGNSNGLRSLPANLIDRVEVITNPSAKFEAEGSAGIINIVLRKQKKKGLNGSFDFTVGDPSIYGTAINLNFRRKKLNFFTNLGINYGRNFGGGDSYQEFYRGDTTEITLIERKQDRGGISGNIRFGADYYLNDKNTFTTSFLYRLGQDDNISTVDYQDFINNQNNFLSRTFRTDEEIEDESKLEYALTYTKKFEGKGHELVADVRFQDNTEKESSDFNEEYFLSDGARSSASDYFQRSNNKEGERRLITRLDYVKPFGKDKKLEAGYQGSYRYIKNDYLVEEQIANDEWVVFDGLSNDFKYDEEIHALYSTFGNKINKFSFQFGARVEYSDVVTELIQTNEINPRDYLNFFPSAFLTYDLPNNNAIQASYSRRLRRPRFWSLNPFFTLSDARNRFTGNPDLDPEFTDSYEIGHIKYWDKGSLGSSIYYRHTTGVIQRVISDVQVVDSLVITLRRPENLATRDDLGFEFNFSYSPYKWWKVNGDMNLFRSIIDGSNVNDSFTADTYTMSGRITSRMTIMKKTDVQLRVNYRAPRETTQGTTKAITSLNLGMSRDVFKKKGTLTLSVSDVFNSRKRRGTLFTDNLYREEEFQWRGRTTRLTLNYRLNQKKKRGGRRGGSSYEGGGGEF
jgi:ferric enterobactin receptor